LNEFNPQSPVDNPQSARNDPAPGAAVGWVAINIASRSMWSLQTATVANEGVLVQNDGAHGVTRPTTAGQMVAVRKD